MAIKIFRGKRNAFITKVALIFGQESVRMETSPEEEPNE